jgi:hypothetical protein
MMRQFRIDIRVIAIRVINIRVSVGSTFLRFGSFMLP